MKLEHRNLRHEAEPRWLPHARLPRTHVPARLLCWLLERASLTRRVQHACPGRFRVEVLEQGWARPMRNETRALGMRLGTLGLVRQVRLLCDGDAWVFARTVIPYRTLHGAQRQLGHLGTRPLGAVLFADQSMRRGEVELACIRPGQGLFEIAVQDLGVRPREIWGRRSVFRVGGKPLLVSEIFLPGIRHCRTNS